jgi:hypothetical protein
MQSKVDILSEREEPRPFEGNSNSAAALSATPIEIAWRPDLSIYASAKFLRAVGDSYGWLGGADETGKVRCILPYTVLKKPGVRMVRFRIETIPMAEGLSLEEERSFLNSAVGYFRSSGADMIIPPSTNALFQTYPTGAIAAPYSSFVIDLRKDEDALFNQMSASHRKKVRHAARGGVQIKCGLEYVQTAHDIIKGTLRRSSLGFMEYARFSHLIHSLGDNVKLFVAEHKGIVRGCTLFPFSSHSAYSLYGGCLEGSESGTMNLLNWEAIRLFRDLGVERFDFVGARRNPEPGSKQEGIMIFKQRFGGELHEGYAWKYPIRRFKYLIYCMGVKYLRGGDIVDQEKHKLPMA